jgi:hypothetical protein
MEAVLFVALVLSAPPEGSDGSQPGHPSATGQRRYYQIDQDVRSWLKQESRAQTPQQRIAAVRNLARLYDEIRRDPRLPTSPTLQEYRTRVRSRLLRIRNELQRDLSRNRARGARGGRAGPPDWGEALVSLIERTIAPDFWDVHGGPGTIVYYRPLHALVVRATDDVHGRVGRVLTDLRDAGR